MAIPTEQIPTFSDTYDFPPEAQSVPRSIQRVGQGAFGCVVRVPLRPELSWRKIYDNLAVIAIKYETPEDVRVCNRDADREYLIAQNVDRIRDKMVLSMGTAPISLGLRVFRSFKIPSTMVSEEWKQEIKPLCTRVVEEIESNEKMLYAMEMELASSSSLAKLVYELTKLRRDMLEEEELQWITFQISFAMDIMQRELVLRHHDLKADNVFAFDVPTPGNQGLPPRRFPFILKIGDFGLSRTQRYPGLEKGQKGSTPNWTLQPVNWFLTAGDKVNDLSIDPNTVDLDADVWSLGLLIIHMGLQGLDLSEFAHFLSEQIPPPTPVTFFYDHAFRTVWNYRPFEDAVFEELINEVGDDRPVQDLLPRIKVLAVLCQIQEALGNGFLPEFIPPNKRNAYYRSLYASKTIILDSCRREMDTEEDGDDNPNIFDFLISKLRTKIGMTGIDFVRRCMAWDPRDRQAFLDLGDMPHKRMFAAALEHPFLSRFKSL